MIDTPHIAQSPSQQTAVIHLTIPREEIGIVMGPGIGELMAAVAAQGIATAGPWFPDPATWRTELNRPLIRTSG